MDSHVKKLIKPIILFAVVIFGLCCFIKKPVSIDEYGSYIGYAISGVSILFVLYERFLWKVIPWNRPPVLKKHYDGMITYLLKKDVSSKKIDISVKQTWLSVRITTKTDINSSNSIVGEIIDENGERVLYYSYITNPSAVTQKTNPVQYGTCRIVLTKKCEKMQGKYWTTSQTLGDIEWIASGKE